MVWYGELTTGSSLVKRGLLLLAPGIVWLMAFLVIPALALVVVSFASRGAYGEIDWTFSLENYKRLAGFGLLGWSADYLLILWRSTVVAAVTTLLCVVVSYPLAFFLSSRPERTRIYWLTALIVPFWVNMVIRAYALFLVLAPDLPLGRLAVYLGFVSEGSLLYPGPFAVYLGMVSMCLPFVALPLYSNVERLNWEMVEAAQDLYASRLRVFTQAILPQTLPGLTVGAVLCFVPAMGAFVVPDILGGAKYMLVGNLIQQQFGPSQDWAFGAAVSMGLTILTLVSLHIYRRWGKEAGYV